MAFMRAEVSTAKELFLVSDDIEDPVFCRYNGIDLPCGYYDDKVFNEDNMTPREFDEYNAVYKVLRKFPRMKRFEIVSMYYGRLTAPGYMDCTEYVLGDTIAEVAQALLDMYYDTDGMDDDEKEDEEMLMRIVENAWCV